MKKLLLAGVAAAGLMTAGAASAADLPARRMAPPPPMVQTYAPVPIFTWTGFYAGVQLGYGWNDNNNDAVFPTAFVRNNAGVLVPFNGTFDRGDSDGFLAGAHAGYNWQIGTFVLGVEGDIEGVFSDNNDDNFFGGGVVLRDRAGNPILFSLGPTSLDWQGSLRARAGVAFDRLLVYGTAGWAFGGVSGGFSNTFLFNSNDDTLSGWTAGVGLEYAFTNNLTTRLEYRFTSYDRAGDIFNNVSLGGEDFDFHTIRAGVTFKF